MARSIGCMALMFFQSLEGIFKNLVVEHSHTAATDSIF